MSLTANTDVPVGKRKLTQKQAAFALAVGLLAIPSIPMLLEAAVPERAWDTAAAGDATLEIVSAAGTTVIVTAPDGWETQDNGDTAVLRSEGAAVLVQIYDLDGREPGSVAQRLLRANRVQGMPAALDGGEITSTDGDLTGDTCVVVTDNTTGTCAYVADEDVMVSVIALGDAEHPALPIADVVGPLSRSAR